MLILDSVRPVARKTHQCLLCFRTIQPGEKYQRQRSIGDDGPYTFTACAHCDALATLIDVWGRCDQDGGYTAEDIAETEPQSIEEARWLVQWRRKWRRRDGALYEIPTHVQALRGER